MNDSAQSPKLEGLRVLVVEDEAPIALQLEDMLSELGCGVIGPASRVGQALRLIEGQEVDAAVLDLNIAGELVYRSPTHSPSAACRISSSQAMALTR
ncbi:MAG: hypothetical protein R3D30_04400 [Hyphomicrobiales bacterium]